MAYRDSPCCGSPGQVIQKAGSIHQQVAPLLKKKKELDYIPLSYELANSEATDS